MALRPVALKARQIKAPAVSNDATLCVNEVTPAPVTEVDLSPAVSLLGPAVSGPEQFAAVDGGAEAASQ